MFSVSVRTLIHSNFECNNILWVYSIVSINHKHGRISTIVYSGIVLFFCSRNDWSSFHVRMTGAVFSCQNTTLKNMLMTLLVRWWICILDRITRSHCKVRAFSIYCSYKYKKLVYWYMYILCIITITRNCTRPTSWLCIWNHCKTVKLKKRLGVFLI